MRACPSLRAPSCTVKHATGQLAACSQIPRFGGLENDFRRRGKTMDEISVVRLGVLD